MMTVKSRIGLSAIDGIGVYALEDIAKGEVIWEYTDGFDRVYTAKKIRSFKKPLRGYLWKYSFKVAKGLYVFCADSAKYFNHSDNPNTDSDELFEKTIAARDIKAGEELTCNYEEIEDTIRGKRFAQKCRKHAI